ncbi:hypothetical protein FJ364_04745, partial [Candidatus Dependentiae bacterium]|nr:hypothetical protein [Candidatus Dependentiae bacterium]
MRNFITTFTMLILIQSAVFAGKKNKKKHSDPVQSIVEATRQLSVSTTSPTLLNQSAYALSASAIKDCRDFHKSLKN